jgi:hypothetical protein
MPRTALPRKITEVSVLKLPLTQSLTTGYSLLGTAYFAATSECVIA